MNTNSTGSGMKATMQTKATKKIKRSITVVLKNQGPIVRSKINGIINPILPLKLDYLLI